MRHPSGVRLAGLTLGLAAAWLLAAAPANAVTFPWKAKFTKASSPVLAAIHEQIHADHSADLKGYRIEKQTWTEEDFKLEIESGKVYLEPDIAGAAVGAFFEGKAVFSFAPRFEGPRGGLRTAFGRPTLASVPIETAYIFTLRQDSPLKVWASGAQVPGAPAKSGTYVADKSAMRQLGLDLTTAILNREGPAKGTTYILMPMTEIRKPGSEEARVLYRMNPTSGLSVGLAVFGHQELTPVKPFKFQFFTLASYSGSKPSPGIADVERSIVKVEPGAGSIVAAEEANVQLRLSPGVNAIRFQLSTWMEVSAITGDGERQLPFLQWQELKTQPDLDGSLLIQVVDGAAPAKTTLATVKVTSSGRLFEPRGNLFQLTAETQWYPLFFSNDEAHHELELTIPKGMTGIGIGERISEQMVGQKKRLVYRTTQPNTGSTFYYGDYTVEQGTAEGIAVELYVDRKDIKELHNARTVLGELTGALSYFTSRLCPLDIKSLRAVSTPTAHARGFEGLILMGGMGAQTNAKALTDVSRAHAVALQWWGNYVRLKFWPRDRWLFAALADYLAMEFYRASTGDDRKALEAMQERWFIPLTFGSMERKNLSGEKEQLVGSTSYPLVAATDNVYTKGPMVIHMLRRQFRLQKDDEAFFVMLQDFLKTYRYQPVSTDDFKAIAEKHLGVSLDWFFKQWVTDGGIPVLVWNAETTRQGTRWSVAMDGRQEQRNYKLNVPVRLKFPSGKVEIHDWEITGETAKATFETDEEPTEVTLNDDFGSLVILKRMKAR